MKKLSQEAMMSFLAKKKMVGFEAQEAAIEVRTELLAAINENRAHKLSELTIAAARKAEPYGTHPSHTTLLTCYGL